MTSKRRQPNAKKTATLVIGAVGAFAGSSGALAQCVQTATNAGTLTQVTNAAFGSGTALASIVSTIGVVNTSSLAQSSPFTGAAATNQTVMQGGVWVREVGGKVDSKADSVGATSVNYRFNDGSTLVGTGTQNCQTSTRTEYIGTQLGFDIARLNLGAGNHLTLGLTAGYNEIISKDRTQGDSTFRSHFQVPFGGIYGALNLGPMSFDAQLRYDNYSAIVNDYIFAGNNRNQNLYSQNLTADSVTFIGNAAYRFNVPSSTWFVTPSVGVIWSRANVDDLNNSGNAILPGFGGTPPATAKFGSIDTFLGRASVQVGTTISTPTMIWQPFAVASVFHEFAGDVKATARGDWSRLGPGESGGGAGSAYPTGTSDVSLNVSRVGTYAHIGGGVAGLVVDSGWSGYARVDYREGDNIKGINFNVGGRYQFAADGKADGLKDGSLKDGGPRHVAATNWSGAYVGITGSGVFAQSDWKETAIPANFSNPIVVPGTGMPVVPAGALVGGGDIDVKSNGILGSGQIGYNMQFGTTVLGVEAEWGVANAFGGNGCPGNFAYFNFGVQSRSAWQDCKVSIDQLGFVTGRIGHTWDRALLYIKGGLAFGRVEAFSRYRPNPTIPIVIQDENREVGETQRQYGWAIGAGVEYALPGNWSIKGEVMHFDLGAENFRFDSGTNFNRTVDRIPGKVRTDGEIARVGVNYRFGGN